MKQPEELNIEFEQKLAEALRQVAAPEGFAERVMARSQEQPATRGKVLTMPLRSRPWISGAIAAVLLVGIYGGEQIHQRHQREQAERAQQQFDAGMRITDQTLDHVRLQLQQAGISLGD